MEDEMRTYLLAAVGSRHARLHGLHRRAAD
jgi:hypothetical protein